MKVTVQYGDLHQAHVYKTLPEHMAKFARDAEAAEPGGNHTLTIPPAKAWPTQDRAVTNSAIQFFYSAVERIRSDNEAQRKKTEEAAAKPAEGA